LQRYGKYFSLQTFAVNICKYEDYAYATANSRLTATLLGGFWGANVLFNTHLAKKSYCATENVAAQ
jgi:hypothetical protein